MKQSDIAKQLGRLMDQQDAYGGQIPSDCDIPSELEEPAPVFEFDYDNELNEAIQAALKTVTIIVNSVVPDSYRDDELLVNKMLLDANQLGQLYYQQKTQNVALKCVMNLMAAGSTDSKIFDNFTKMDNRMSKLSEQITETQNQFRKYYIDTYLDVETKRQMDESEEEVEVKKLTRQYAPKSIGNKQPEIQEVGFSEAVIEEDSNAPIITDDGGVRFSGNKSAVNKLNDIKKDMYRKAKQKDEDNQ